MPEPELQARLWRLYARHAASLFSGGPRPDFEATDRWFFAASGAHHLDMNQGALFGGAAAGDAEQLVERVLVAGVPFLLGCSDGVLARVSPTLSNAGFVRLPNREAFFWRPGDVEVPEPSPFEVRQVRNEVDVLAMLSIFEDAHGYDPAAMAAMYGDRVTGNESLSAWLAWDGAEPVSLTIVIAVGASLSIWDVMTPPQHRRRGGARAVVTGALACAAAVAARPIEETLFWSSPAGRPLYEAMGFVVADEVDAWVLGASAEDLAAVGA